VGAADVRTGASTYFKLRTPAQRATHLGERGGPIRFALLTDFFIKIGPQRTRRSVFAMLIGIVSEYARRRPVQATRSP
jgi:hypothetical protein